LQPSLLLSKALKLQQENEDKKNEFIINDLLKKIETLENSLKEKDSLLNIAEGSLAEARLRSEKQSIQILEQNTRIEELNKELEKTKPTLKDSTRRFNREAEVLNLKVKAKDEKKFKLSETSKRLGDKCFGFATQCSSRLRSIFNSIGATSEEAHHSADDIPMTLEWIEKKLMTLMK
jgi:site-specific recombinase